MRQYLRYVGVALLLGLLGLLGQGQAHAQGQGQAAQTFTLQPGGRATITFEGFCTNFGQNFPDSVQAPNALGQAGVRGAMAYIQQQGLSGSDANALDAQYGLWRVVGAAGSPQGGQIANDVVNAANTAVQDPQGTSVLDAAKSGQVRVTIDSWQPLGQPVQIGAATDNFYGRGTMTVENTSGQALTLYHPVGALYPPAVAGDQTMAAYATSVQVQNPAPTPQPTAAAGTGANPQPTAAAGTGANPQPTAAAGTGANPQPSSLPQTGAGDSGPSLAGLALLALLCVALGWGARRLI